VKVGVIGAGRWGANIVRTLSELGVLESICDANEAAIALLGEQYPDVALELEVTSLLQRDIDAVAIAAPAVLHAELALEAIEAGKHVFVEKPLAMSADDAAMVVRAARARGLTVFVGHVLLHHPAVKRAFELIEEGAIGDVRHLRSRRLSWGTLRSSENVWWSFAPHDVSLALAIFGEMPVSVNGSELAYVQPNIADFAYADLTFTGRRSAHIEVSWLDPNKTSQLDIFGSTGVLTLKDSREGATLTLTPCGEKLDASGKPLLWREEPVNVEFAPEAPLKAELRAFCENVARGTRPLTDGENGLQVVQVLGMLGRSQRRPSLEEIA
jgi:UDP-2-acetamido-3-amino-2,3-dideoxy-glucuronate N-acetyltransferase